MIEKKLILCAIVAITFGIATVVPLSFFMMPARAQTDLSTPWFNFNVPYASWSTSISIDTSSYVYGVGNIGGLVTYSSTSTIILNFTVNPDAVNIFANARIEYFQIQVYSDQGQIENETTFFGANCTGFVDPSSSFHFDRADWFNTTTSGGGTFIARFNGTIPLDLGLSGTGGTTTSSAFANSTLPRDFLNVQNAKTLYMDVRRLGYVTFNGNSTIVTLSNNEGIQHIELKKYGDSFIYGTKPQNLLLQTNPLVPAQNP